MPAIVTKDGKILVRDGRIVVADVAPGAAPPEGCCCAAPSCECGDESGFPSAATITVAHSSPVIVPAAQTIALTQDRARYLAGYINDRFAAEVSGSEFFAIVEIQSSWLSFSPRTPADAYTPPMFFRDGAQAYYVRLGCATDPACSGGQIVIPARRMVVNLQIGYGRNWEYNWDFVQWPCTIVFTW